MFKQIKKLRVLIIGTAILSAVFQLHSQDLYEARNFTSGEQFDSAVKMFKILIEKDPNNGTYYYYFGDNFLKKYFTDTLSYSIKEASDEALVYYKKGLEVDPNNPLNNVGLGKIALFNGDIKTAKSEFDIALSKFPSKINKSSKLSKKNQALTLMSIAEAYIKTPKKKDIPYALSLIEKAIGLDTKNPEIYLIKGDAYLELNDGTNAIANYKKAEELNPKSPKAKLRIGQLRYRTKQYQDAQAYYKEALLIDSTYAPAYLELGITFAKTGQNEIAKNFFQKYLDLSDNVSAKIKYGLVLYDLKDYADAIVQFNEVAILDSSRNDLNRALAYCYYENKNYEKALFYINKFFLQTMPEKTINLDYVYYARILAKNNLDSLAVIQYKLAFERDSVNMDMLSEMSTSFAKMKKYQDAANVLTEKISLMKKMNNDPKTYYTDYYNLGKYFYNIGNWTMADSAFSDAINIEPNFIQGIRLKAITINMLDPNEDANKKPLLIAGKAKPYFELLIQKTDQDSVKYTSYRLEAYNYLGYYYLLYKDYCNSLQYWEKITTIEPTNENAKSAIKELKGKCIK